MIKGVWELYDLYLFLPRSREIEGLGPHANIIDVRMRGIFRSDSHRALYIYPDGSSYEGGGEKGEVGRGKGGTLRYIPHSAERRTNGVGFSCGFF